MALGERMKREREWWRKIFHYINKQWRNVRGFLCTFMLRQLKNFILCWRSRREREKTHHNLIYFAFLCRRPKKHNHHHSGRIHKLFFSVSAIPQHAEEQNQHTASRRMLWLASFLPRHKMDRNICVKKCISISLTTVLIIVIIFVLPYSCSLSKHK